MKRKGNTLYEVLDVNTGQYATYNKSTKLKSGANITDDNCDGVVIRKLGNEYFKLNVDYITPEMFGAKGDGITDDTLFVQRAFDAMQEGDTIFFANKKYKLSHIVRIENKKIVGNYSEIIQKGNQVVFEGKGRWSNITNVTSLEKVEVLKNGRPHYVTKVYCTTTGYSEKDIIKIFSDDLIPDNSIGQRYLGEFAQIIEVEAGYILLNSILEDTYTTNIRIAKNLKDTISITGFAFDREDGPFVIPPDSGSGQSAFIRLSGLLYPHVNNIKVKNSISNAIVFHSCYGYNAENVYGENLPNEPLIKRWGYLICDANSQFGSSTNLSAYNVRHAFTTNTYDIDSNQNNPSNYGRSKDFTVTNARAFGGFTAHFDTHDGAKRGVFNNCFGANIDWGKDINTEIGVFSACFTVRSSGLKITNCGTNADTGIYVFTSNNQQGGDSDETKVKGVEIHNFSGIVKRTALYVNNADVKVSSSNFERAKGIDFGRDSNAVAKMFIVQNSTTKITDTEIVDRGYNDSNLFTIANSNVNVDSSVIDLSEVSLNELEQQTNYAYNLFYTYQAIGMSSVQFNNSKLLLKDRIIDAIANCNAAINNNVSFFSKNIDAFVTSSIQTIDTGGLFTRRIIGESFSNVQIVKNHLTSKVKVSNFQYVDSETNNVTSNHILTQSTSVIQNFGKSDMVIISNINPPTDNFEITQISAGTITAQLVTIINTSNSLKILLKTTVSNLNISENITIHPKQEISLRWDGDFWRLVYITLQKEVLTTNTQQRITAEKTFLDSCLITDTTSATIQDRKIRSQGVDTFYERLTSDKNLQIVARDNTGGFLGTILTYLRNQLSVTIGDDLTSPSSSIFTVNSLTKGILPPRMSKANRLAILNLSEGLLVRQKQETGIEAEAGLYEYKLTGGWTKIS